MLTVRLPEPQFEGQTKEVLGTPAVRGIVAHVVDQGAWRNASASTKRGDKTQAALLLDKIVAEMKSRISARSPQGDPAPQERAGELVPAGEARRLPQQRRRRTASCSSSRATRALGTAKLARDSEYQALLPIRGKILNVQKASRLRHARATPSAPRSSR